MKMANEKDLDYKAIGAVILVSAIAFTAVGAFYVRPMLDKRKAKKLTAAKKPQVANKKG
ncbi:hypothetical protein [uncultured Aquimarina sp.]|uniref:hypothetical protein n=1 Tax=uncultured Aquimarina sp. TaxID=575652 RepID=UPI00260F48CA|nr:hypothetical protein [uncultured Aquimarina sp.]